MNKQGDLSVITKVKEVCSYILTITDKSPKRFRFTLVSRLQNYSLTIIEKLIMANEIYVCNNRQEVDENALLERRRLQKSAMTHIKLLAYIAQVSMEQQCILPKQYEQITKKLYDCQNLLPECFLIWNTLVTDGRKMKVFRRNRQHLKIMELDGKGKNM